MFCRHSRRRKGGGNGGGSDILLVLLMTFSQALAGPILGYQEMGSSSSSSCALYCSTAQNSQENSKWKYEVGKIYSYDYSVESATLMEGTSQQASTIKLAATAHVRIASPCDFELKLEDVSVKQGDNIIQKDPVNVDLIKTELEKNAITFAFVDGRIIDICEHKGGEESMWSLNIKKGVISTFQTSVGDWTREDVVTETDVVGTCKTRYLPTTSSWGELAVAATGGTHSITKIKDMKTCENNQRLYQYALNIPDINIQNIPMIESNHKCDIVLNSGHLHTSKCEESHVFKPLSTGTGEETSGAKTIVSQLVKFRGSTISTNSASSTEVLKRSSLMYTHSQNHGESMTSNLEEIALEETIKNILKEFSTARHDKHPDLFTNLVYALRKLGYSQLSKIFYTITDGPTKRFLLDAIPLLKTDGGIALMAELVKSGGLSESTLDIWYSTLPFYKNPSRSMVGSVLEFINDQNMQPRSSALLGVSSLLHTFCKATNECEKLSEVQEVIFKFESFLGQSCNASTQEEEDTIILSLKGLRNIGHLVNADATIVKCYEDESNSMSIRVAAIDTIKKFSCLSDAFDQGLMNTFGDTTKDSELRIGAYLAIMNCPSKSAINSVKSVLTNEPVNQVGSFVWTHLTNIQETQSISANKIALKRLVGAEFLRNKWNTDVRKFSRYFEASHYNKDLNLGTTVDGNIVFSQESYVPRSAMVNLTVSLFGESLNLFEFGARAEGFENMIEDFFGPDGYFREDSFHKLLKGLRGKNSEDSGRNKRDVIKTPKEVISDFTSTFAKYRDDEPSGNVYMRMFGRDTYYQSFNGMAQLLKKVAFLVPAKIFGYNLDDDGLNDINFSRSSIFLDGSIVVPTVSGLPLNLAVNGTSTVQLKSQTNLNVSNLFTSGDALLEAHIYPTATVQVSGVMSLEIAKGLAKTGLKSTTKLHTNTYLDGKIEVEGFKLAKATINMPRDKMEILEVSAEFFTLTSNGQYLPLQSNNPTKKINGCTPNLFSNIFGIELCAEAEYSPNPNSPQNGLATYFAGPSNVQMHLHKTDVFSKYIFKYEYTEENASIQKAQQGKLKEINLLFDTPGSNINRRSSIEIKADVNNWQYVSFGMEMPFKQIKINLVYDWGSLKKLLKGGLIMSGKNIILFRSQLKTNTPSEKYEAKAEFSYLDQQYLKWSGELSLSEQKTSLSAKFEGTAHDPIIFTGDIVKNGDRFTTTSSLKSSFITAKLSGLVKQTDSSLNAKLNMMYKTVSSGEQNLALNGEYKFTHMGLLSRHNVLFSLNPTQFPQFNSEVTWEMQTSSNYIENMGKIRVGRQSWEITQQYSSQATDQLREFIFKNGIKDATSGVEFKVDFSHKMSDLENRNKFELRLNKLFYINAHLDHVKTSNPMSHNISVGAAYGDYKIDVGLQVGDDGLNSYSGKAYASWGVNPQTISNQKIAAEFTIRKGTGPNLDYKLLTKLEIPYLEPIQVGGTLLIDPANTSTFALNWVNGQGQNYTLDLEYKAFNREYEINALLRMNELLYKCSIALRNDATKMAKIDLITNKHYYLNINATNMFRNIGFDFYWDMDNDKEKSLNFHSIITTMGVQHPTVMMQFKLLGHDGTFKGVLLPQGFESTINYNGDKMVVKGNYIYSQGVYGLGGSIASTIDIIRDISFLANFKYIKNAYGDGLNLIDLKINANWNDNFKHSFEIMIHKNGMDEINGKFGAQSTHEPFDGISSTFNYSRVDETIQARLLLFKRSTKQIEINVNNQNGNVLKTGTLVLETPFQIIQNIKLSYHIRFGKELHFKGGINHNLGINRIDADIKLAFETDEKKIDFLIDHTWGEKINGSIYLKGEDFSKQVSAAAKLFVGKCGFDLENEYSYTYSHTDILKVHSKLFAGCKDKAPVNFILGLEAINQRNSRFPQSNDNHYLQKRDIHLNQSLSIGSDQLTDFVFNGKIFDDRNTAIKFRGNMLSGRHEVTVDAKNNGVQSFEMHSNYVLDGQVHAKANLNWSISKHQDNKDMNIVLLAGFEIPLAQSRKYLINFTHNTSSNGQLMRTKLNIVPGGQENVFTANNEAEWNMVGTTLSFRKSFDLITPFEYMKVFKLDIDGNGEIGYLNGNRYLNANIKGNWNSKKGELKIILDRGHTQIGKEFYSMEGTFDQVRMLASFSILRKGYTQSSNWNGDTLYEFKFVDINGDESSLRIIPWKENDYTFKLKAKLPNYIMSHTLEVFQRVVFKDRNQLSLTLKLTYGANDFIDFFGKVIRSVNADTQRFYIEGKLESPGLNWDGWKMEGSVKLIPHIIKYHGKLHPFDTINTVQFGIDTNIKVIELKRTTEVISVQLNATQSVEQGSKVKLQFTSKLEGFENLLFEGSLKNFSLNKIDGIMKFECNGKHVIVETKSEINQQSTNKFETSITSTLFAPKFNHASFVAHYDNLAKKWSAEGSINREKVKFSGGFSNQIGFKKVEASLVSTAHSFEKIDMSGTLKKTNLNAYTITFSGNSKDMSHSFNLQGKISPENGEIVMEVKLPFVAINHEAYQIHYLLQQSGLKGRLGAIFNGNQYNVTWAKNGQGLLKIDILTPIQGLERGSIHTQISSFDDPSQYFNLKATVNENDLLKIDFWFKEYKTLKFVIKTGFEMLNEIKFKYDFDARKMIEMSLRFNNVYATSIQGSIANSYQDAEFMFNMTSPKMLPIYIKTGYQLYLGDQLKDKTLYFDFVGMQETIHFNTALKAQAFEFELASNMTENIKLFAAWSNPGSVIVHHNNSVLFKIVVHEKRYQEMPRNYNDYKGEIKISAYFPTAYALNFYGPGKFTSFKNSSLSISFDLGNTNRKVALKAKLENMFLNVGGRFQMTEDTFNGTFEVTSSQSNFKNVKIGVMYNISVKPSATLVIERNGIRRVIKIQVTFDNIIPTVSIKTPFENYENIVLSGTYKSNNNKRIVEFEININEKQMLLLITHISANMDYSKFGLMSTLTTPSTGWQHELMNNKTIRLELGWSAVDPYSATLRLVNGNVEYLARGSLSVDSKEFNINMVSPFDGYEYINFGGKFGTTTVGQQFGVTYQHNMVKRDLEFEYGTKDGISEMRIRTPIRQIRSVTARTMLRSGINLQAQFDFETEGEEHEFAFGVQYALKRTSRGAHYGNVKIKLIGPILQHDYSMLLDYKITDVHMQEGFDVSLDIMEDSTRIASFLANQKNTFTNATLTTPFEGYRKMHAEFKTDIFTNNPPTTASLRFKLENNIVGFKVTKQPLNDNVQITIDTPSVPYRKLVVSLTRGSGDRSCVINVKRYNNIDREVQILKLTLAADIYPENLNVVHPMHLFQLKKFNIKGKLEIGNQGMIWANLILTGDVSNLKSIPFSIELTSSSEKCKILKLSAILQPAATNSGTGQLELDVKYNKQTLNYVSKIVQRTNSIKASSILKTNIRQLGVNERKTNYEISWTNDYRKVLLKYQQTDDGVIVGEVTTSLTIQPRQGVRRLDENQKFTFRFSLFWPNILGKNDKITIAAELDNRNQNEATFKFKWEFGEQEVKTKFAAKYNQHVLNKHSSSIWEAGQKMDVVLQVVPTNMPIVPKIDANWNYKDRTEDDLQRYVSNGTRISNLYFNLNDFEIVNVTANINSKNSLPIKAVVEASLFGTFKQKLDYMYTKAPRNFAHQVTVKTSGTSKFGNGKIDIKWTSGRNGKFEGLVEGLVIPGYRSLPRRNEFRQFVDFYDLWIADTTELPPLLLKSSWMNSGYRSGIDHQWLNTTVEMVVGGVVQFSSELSIDQVPHHDHYAKGKIFSPLLGTGLGSLGIGFPSTALNIEFECKRPSLYKLNTEREHNFSTKILAKLGSQILYKEDSKIKWSPQESDINIKIESDFIKRDGAFVQFSGKRTGDITTFLYPFVFKFMKMRGSNRHFMTPSSMEAKYTLNINGAPHVMETNINIKNLGNHDYSWTLTTPSSFRPRTFWPILPFVKSGISSSCHTSNNNNQYNCNENMYVIGRRIFLSGPYEPTKTETFSCNFKRVKHTERLRSGSRRYDDVTVEFKTPIPGLEEVTFSRKASIDQNAFLQANRTSPIHTSLVWPGGEINFMEYIALKDNSIKIQFHLSTPFHEMKKIKYDFSANQQHGTEQVYLEAMGGYVNWSSDVEKKHEKHDSIIHYDIKYRLKSSWIPKVQVDSDISIKLGLPESVLNAVVKYGGNPIIKLESKAKKTLGGGRINLDLEIYHDLDQPLKSINADFAGELKIKNDGSGFVKLKLNYNLNNVEFQASNELIGQGANRLKAKLSSSKFPTTTLNIAYGPEIWFDYGLKVDANFEIENLLTAAVKTGEIGQKFTCQASLKGALIENREYDFFASLDIGERTFVSIIKWTKPNGQDKKEIKLKIESSENTDTWKVTLASPFRGYENMSLEGTKTSLPGGVTKYKAIGNINNVPHSIDLEIKLRGKINIKWKALRGAKDITFLVDIESKHRSHHIGKIILSGSDFKTTSINFEIERKVPTSIHSGSTIIASVDVQTPIPSFEKFGGKVLIEGSRKNYHLQIKAHRIKTIFELEGQMSTSSELGNRLKLSLVVPDLGLTEEKAIKFELVYRPLIFDYVTRKGEFEIGGMLLLLGSRNEVKIKCLGKKLYNDSGIIGVPLAQVTENIEGEFILYSDWIKEGYPGLPSFIVNNLPNLAYIAEMSQKFGYESKSQNIEDTDDQNHVYRHITHRGYLNENELTFAKTTKKDKRNWRQNFYHGDIEWYGIYVERITMLDINMNIDLVSGFDVVTIVEEFTGTRIPAKSKFMVHWDEKFYKLTPKDNRNTLKASITVGEAGQQDYYGKISTEFVRQAGATEPQISQSNDFHNGVPEIYLGKLNIDLPRSPIYSELKRSASVLIELPHNRRGEDLIRPARFEITYGIDENNRISMAMSTLSRQKRDANPERYARATIASAHFGNFDFEFHHDLKQGIVVFSIPSGLHKVSYEISDKNFEINGYEVLVKLETPLLDQGRAQLKLNIGNPRYTEYGWWNSGRNGFNLNYRGQLSLNSQHFISASLKMDTASEIKGFDTSFAIETSYLPEDWNNLHMTINAWTHQQPKKATAKLEFRHGDIRHEFSGFIDATNYNMNLLITSPLLLHIGGHTRWQLEGRLSNFEKEYAADAIFKVSDENLVQLSFQSTVNGVNDLYGSLYYHAPKLVISQAKFTYKIFVTEDNAVLDFDITSSGNIDFPRGRVFFELTKSGDGQTYAGNFKIIPPTQMVPHLDGNITVPHPDYITNNTIRLEVHAPLEQHSVILDWDIELEDIQGTLNFNAKYIGPYGAQKLIADFKMKYVVSEYYDAGNGFLRNLRLYDIQIEGDVDASTFGHKLSSKLSSKNGVGILKGDIDVKININDDVIETGLIFNFIDSGKELSGYLKTPFIGYEQHGFEIAFENSNNRKTAKAHVFWPNDKFGVKIDFGVASISDLVIHVQLDVPIPGLSFNTLHIKNKLTNKAHTFVLTGQWGVRSIGITSELHSTRFGHQLEVQADLNEHILKASIGKSTSRGNIDCSIKGAKIPWFDGSHFSFQTDFLRDRQTCNFLTCEKIELKYKMNGTRYIYMTHNPVTGSAKIEFQKLFSLPTEYKLGVTYDTTADENGHKVLQIRNTYKNLDDVDGRYIKSEFFLRCQEDSISDEICPKLEFSLKTLWPTGDISETRGNLQYNIALNNSNIKYNIAYIQNNAQVFMYESTSEAVFDVNNGIDTSEKSRLVIPSHTFIHTTHYRAKLDGTVFDYGHDCEWGRNSEDQADMKKLSFGIARNKVYELGLTETKLVFKRRLQRDVDQMMLFRYADSVGITVGNGDKYKEIEFKAQHPNNVELNMNFQGRLEFNCNHETSKAKMSFKQKWGNELTFNELTLGAVLNKIDGSVVIDVVFPEGTKYNLEGMITASNILGELRHGLSATLTRNGKLDRSFIITVYPVIHALQLESIHFDHLDNKLGKSFKLFAGFVDEEATTFAIRVLASDELSTVKPIDHSVVSVVNAIDGIGNSTDEISLMIRLSQDGDSIETNISWPPHLTTASSQLLQDVKTALKRTHDNSDNFGVHTVNELRKVGHLFYEADKAVYSDVMYILEGDEVINQYEEVANFISKNFREAASYVNLHIGVGDYLSRQLKGFSTMLGSAVQISMNVVKSLDTTLMRFLNGMYSFADAQLTYIHKAIIDIRKSVIKHIIWFLPDDTNIEMVTTHIKEAVKHLRSTILRVAGIYRRFVIRFGSKIEFAISDFLTDLKSDFKMIAREFSRNFKQFKALRKMVQFYYDYQSWLEEVHFSEHLENTSRDVERYINTTMVHFEDLRLLVSKYVTEVTTFVYSKYVTISSYPPVAFAGSLLKKAGFLTLNAIANPDNLGSYHLRRLAGKILARADAMASTTVRLVDVLFHGSRDFISYEMDFKPLEGRIEYIQVLPFTWYSFKDTPDIVKLADLFIGTEDTEGEDALDVDMIEFQHELLEAIDTVSQAITTRAIIPPFSATAFVAGDSHMKTFDGKFYDFVGAKGCSYLLVSDFLHNRFSVFATYNGMTRSSISVISDNKVIKIVDKIDQNTKDVIKVTVDRRSVELPMTFNHTYIKREGSTITVEHSEGLRVVCNVVHRVCSVTVSGWYFGKTGGLLGVYDNEIANDWMTSDREVASSLDVFVSSWHIDDGEFGNCPVKEEVNLQTNNVEQGATVWEVETCSNIFGGRPDVNSVSPLMPCYSSLDPKPYRDMCLKDIRKVRNRPEQMASGICLAAASYIEQCKLLDVELWMPNECIKCEGGASGFQPGESTTMKRSSSVNPTPNSADIVFVTEQKNTCNNAIYANSLKDLPTLMDKALKDSTISITDNRFAIVGYGSGNERTGPLPHTFTISSGIFSSADKVAFALNRLETTGRNSNRSSEVFNALQYAARLPFRPGVSKTIVLVTCDNSGKNDGSFYGDAMTMLKEAGITLHHLSPTHIALGGKRSWLTKKLYKPNSRVSGKKAVFGFNRNAVFTANGQADTVLRKQLNNPKDYLSTLAIQSGHGSVFDLTKLDQSNRNTAKKAGLIMAKQIALSGGQPRDCQVCDCLVNKDGQGSLQCSVCIMPEMDLVQESWKIYGKYWNDS